MFVYSKIIIDNRTNVWYIVFTNFEQTFLEVELCTMYAEYLQIEK